jgi:hypothetical protein
VDNLAVFMTWFLLTPPLAAIDAAQSKIAAIRCAGRRTSAAQHPRIMVGRHRSLLA